MQTISSTKDWHVVTNCSSIKKRKDSPLKLDPSQQNFENFCKSWTDLIKSSVSQVSAMETYGGRTFIEAVAVTEKIQAELHVVSAGLGLIQATQRIPNYNLTVSKGEGSIGNWLATQNKSVSDWWLTLNQHLGKPNAIERIIKSSDGVIFALPSTYLEMIDVELEKLSADSLNKIFIITSTAGRKAISSKLKQRALPYDERLDGAKNYQGTRNDFAQRALKHFVNEIDFLNHDIDSIKNEISNYLKKHKKPDIPSRIKLTDDAILLLIEKNWKTYGGTRDKLHRFLRDTALVACEQNRFGALWNIVRESRNQGISR
jgi:hypothetical protein